MAMMISRFHKLIQSKILWGVFLVVIIFSFVIWGSQSPGRARRHREQTAAGKLDGEFVPQETLREMYRNEYVGLLLSAGRGFQVNDRMDRLLREAAWRRLVSLREGARLGLAASDREVVQAIRSQPMFQEDGAFSLARYRGFLAQALGDAGLSERFFEEHVRQELLLQKLRLLVQQSVLVPPLDVERVFRALGDRVTVRYATATRADVTNEVEVTDAQVRAFFERDPSAYELPPRVSVRFVFFPVDRFLSQTADPDPRDVEDYYADHADAFRVLEPATNAAEAVETAGDGEPAAAPEPRWVTQPLEAVRGEIERRLRVEGARARAREEADALVRKLSTYFQDNPMPFDDAAREMGLEVYTPEPFAETERVPGVAAGSDFNEAAFGLRDRPDEYFSLPVTGEDGVYLAALNERIPARVPALEEVAERVRADALEEAVTEALVDRAGELKRRVTEEGAPFGEAAAALGMALGEPAPFSAADGLGDEPYADALVRAVLHLNAGELSDVVPVSADTVLVAVVVSREPGDAAALAALRPQVAAMLRRERERQLFESWREYLLRRDGFEDLAPRRDADTAPEDETDA